MGALYIFNPTTSALSLEINGGEAGSLRACSLTGYKPFGIRVSRVHTPQAGQPGFGENTLSVTFEADPRQTYVFPFTIPASCLLGEDVVAFALRSRLILTTQSGAPLEPNPLPIPAPPCRSLVPPSSHH